LPSIPPRYALTFQYQIAGSSHGVFGKYYHGHITYYELGSLRDHFKQKPKCLKETSA